MGPKRKAGRALYRRAGHSIVVRDPVVHDFQCTDDPVTALIMRIRAGAAEASLPKRCCGDQGAAAIAESLRASPVISTVILDHQYIKDGGLGEICRAVTQCPLLRELSLEDNRIELATQDAADSLGALMAQVDLRCLRLGMNRIGPAGAARLAEAIEGSGIQQLSIYNNKFKETGALSLLPAIRSCRDLGSLDLSFNFLSRELMVEFSAVTSAVVELRCQRKVCALLIVQHSDLHCMDNLAFPTAISELLIEAMVLL